MVHSLVNKLLEGNDLTQQETFYLMEQMMSGAVSHPQIAALLTALRMKGETVEELIGLVKGMRAYATPLPNPIANSVDTCGTGGDGGQTFNISTATTFVAAAAGVPVAKHGNRAVSSKSGSADVLEALGISLDLTPQEASLQLHQTGVCFLFATLYHPAMKYVMPTRKALGFRTCFNLLGPLASPASVTRQLIGVFAPKWTEKLAQVLQAIGTKHALVVSGLDGLDEITLTGPTQISELKDGKIRTYTVTPADLGFPVCSIDELAGGTAIENATIIRDIFAGERSAKRAIVEANVAAVLYLADKVPSLQAGVQLASQVIDEGLALKKLEEVVLSSQGVKTDVS
jgi:anthranilate phosphoribosyltransferase